MIQILFGAVSFLTGTMVAIQSVVNGRLRTSTFNPMFASFASFCGGLLLLVLMLFGAHLLGIYEIPQLEQLASSRLWMYTGGLIGSLLVIGGVVIPKKIGFASFFSMMVAGQLVGSVIADAIGLFGSEVHAPGPVRIFGVICLVAGALLVQKHK